jgi:hypothetical protein
MQWQKRSDKMAEYDNNNQVAIWKNDKRETDRHPHFKGTGEIDGVEYWVSGWKRDPEGNPKSPALKLRFQRKDEAHNDGVKKAREATQPVSAEELNDDIPF